MIRAKSILFRVHAGPSIGMGHLQRCLSLAMAARRMGFLCTFVTSDLPEVRRLCEHYGVAFRDAPGSSVGSPEDRLSLERLARRLGSTIVLTDSYDIKEHYWKGLRDAGLFVAALDDLAEHNFPCQLVINGGIHTKRLRYRSSSGDTRFLTGTRYAILRPEFWNVPHRLVRRHVRTILLMCGGSDGRGCMPDLLRQIDAVPGDFRIRAVIGPFFRNRREIEGIAGHGRHPIDLIRKPTSVRPLMWEADLAVSAGGQTLYELACTGCPAIAIPVIENQYLQTGQLRREGCVQVVPDGQGKSPEIGKALRELIRSYPRRAAMSKAGQDLVDGRGALRVATALVRESARAHA